MQSHTSRFKPTISSEFVTLAAMISNNYKLVPTCYLFFREGFWKVENWQSDIKDYYAIVHELVHQLRPVAYSLFTCAPVNAIVGQNSTLYAITAYAGGQTMTFSRQFEILGKHDARFIDGLKEDNALFSGNPLSQMFTTPPPPLPSKCQRESFMDDVRSIQVEEIRPYL